MKMNRIVIKYIEYFQEAEKKEKKTRINERERWVS